MAGSEPYGGASWIQQQKEMLAEIARLKLELDKLRGYTTPQVDDKVRSDALRSIWNQRKDIQDLYKKNGDFANGRWREYVEDWLSWTPEKDAYDDPIAYAQKQGWYTPPEGYTSKPKEVPTLEREQMEQQNLLAKAQLLGSRSGPQDWVSYWNTVRTVNPQYAGIPAWAVNLLQGQANPVSGAQAFSTPATAGIAGLPQFTQQQAAQQAAAQQQAMAQGQAQAQALGLPQIRPNAVTPRMWNSLLPSEQVGLQGLVEQQGGSFSDWVKMMQRAAPQGAAPTRTLWR
jgi:hypothetical protein